MHVSRNQCVMPVQLVSDPHSLKERNKKTLQENRGRHLAAKMADFCNKIGTKRTFQTAPRRLSAIGVTADKTAAQLPRGAGRLPHLWVISGHSRPRSSRSRSMDTLIWAALIRMSSYAQTLDGAPPVSPASVRGPFPPLWLPLPCFQKILESVLPARFYRHSKSPTAMAFGGPALRFTTTEYQLG